MKTINKYSLLLFICAALSIVIVGCDDDEGGEPRVSYIRITRAASSDSLLVSAGQGQMIAIMGDNLQNTQEVWFNDQRATLTATFITNKSIIVRIPSDIPDEITNELRLVFANGRTLTYDFTVDISKPLVNRMKSEYVNIGDVATFYGNFFYAPLEVTFTGGAQAEIVSVEDQILQVIVPDGAQPGPITITSNFGETLTSQWYLDDRNIFADFEGPFANGFWRGDDFVVESDDDVPNINGKFVRVKRGDQGAWPYIEVYGGPADGDVAGLTKVIPEEAFLNPTAFSVKFEINTVRSIAGAVMRLYLGDAPNDDFGEARNNIYYEWLANLDTQGEWETVTLPWSEVYAANQRFPYNSNGYGMYIYFHGPNAATYDFAFDNFRVVPNKSE